MSRIKIRLLGGFEVWHGDSPITGFESQKVRALLTYLVCHGERSFSRDHLAGLFWAGKGKDTARRNLRQAVYNLKSTLPEDHGAAPPILTSHQTLQWNSQLDCWLDVNAFEESMKRGTSHQTVDPHFLAAAVQLYRGDFLADFFLKDSPAFEEWLVSEQERLREAAIEALRILIESYLARGEYRFGIQYARRLVAIDPRSENAHRQLMQLYALSGRRSRALAQYEDLANLLSRELGAQPTEETTALYRQILAERMHSRVHDRESDPIGPIIPLVGRSDAYSRLNESWQWVLRGRGRLTLVGGEAGIGKTRLVKSFLDAATAERRTLILKGRCYEIGPRIPYQPLPELLGNAVDERTQAAGQSLGDLPRQTLTTILPLVPSLADLVPDLAPAEDAELDPAALAEAVAGLFVHFTRGAEDGKPTPVVLLLDDLHCADPAALALIEELLPRLAEAPVWIVASHEIEETSPPNPLSRLLSRAESGSPLLDRLRLQRLDSWAIEEIATSLVGDEGAAELTEFLVTKAQGLPLAVAEWINFLWDEGLLVAQDPGHWRLRGSLSDLSGPPAGDLGELISRRIGRLPTSTRHLAAMAAVMGQKFEAEVLQRSADEHIAVVEVGLEMMIERWLIRQYAQYWTTSRRERDLVLWARGARRGTFEFSHKVIRTALYNSLEPPRRRQLHRHVAAALEGLGDGRTRLCERLAHHYTVGEVWDRAFEYVETSARKARHQGAGDTAVHFYEQAVDVLERLVETAKNEEEAQTWRRRRSQMLNERTQL